MKKDLEDQTTPPSKTPTPVESENISPEPSESPAKGRRGKKGGLKNTPENTAQYNYIIKNKKVKSKTQNRKRVTIILIFLTVLLLLGAGIWGITSFLQFNNFKIMIDRHGENIFSLSPNANLTNKSEVIYLDGPDKMDNITLDGIEHIITALENSEGSVKNNNMVTGTFYLTNVSDEMRNYVERMDIAQSTNHIDSTIRVLIIRQYFDADGKATDREVDCYAKMGKQKNEKGEMVPAPEYVVPLPSNFNTYDGHEILRTEPTNKPWITTPFASDKIIMNRQGRAITKGGKVKYSLAIWIEGYDADTTNEKLGGTIKMDLKFSDSAIK